MRVLDQYGGEVGASTLRAIVDNEIDIELATGADFMRQCGDFRNCFDRDRNTAIIQGGKNVVEYAPSIAHEVTHAILPAAVPYQFQEVMSVQRALDVFSGIPGGGAYSSYYARLLRDRTNNPSAFYLRVFNNALSEIGR